MNKGIFFEEYRENLNALNAMKDTVTVKDYIAGGRRPFAYFESIEILQLLSKLSNSKIFKRIY